MESVIEILSSLADIAVAVRIAVDENTISAADGYKTLASAINDLVIPAVAVLQ
jgi:hypothetical protein